MLMQRWSVNEYQTMPWKNGGGSTTELAIFPAGASLDNFIWRLSTAQVEVDGPFSSFPGIDRTLAVLSGAGLILHTKAEQRTTPSGAVHLTQNSAPYCFAGELAVTAELSAGSVSDLNMMTRRDVCTHTMQKLLAGQHRIHAQDARQMLLYCVAGGARLTTPETAEEATGEAFSSDDLMLLNENRPASGIALELTADEGAILFLITLEFLDKGVD
ncbi:MAG: HutD family protein [Burkholderiaceae bacterium]|nr:HutD family protein [Burkholderiaceae bacterium]